MASEEVERLEAEILLLESMYPEQAHYNAQAREVSYKHDSGAAFTLRLPSGYLVADLPEVLSAHAGRVELREELKQRIKSDCTPGEEVLDSIIAAFDELAQAAVENEAASDDQKTASAGNDVEDGKRATIVVYLHHLLNTNKRKQCLSPAATVSGITKPGYPGVLIYAGPAKAVHDHVNELKGLNWAAFQVRLEADEEWKFTHGSGVVEVESMGEVVAEVDTEKKEMFMEAMRMK